MKENLKFLVELLQKDVIDFRRVQARSLFNDVTIWAWRHAFEHGDTTYLQQIIDSIPDHSSRASFVSRLMKVLPLQISLKNRNRVVVDKESSQSWSEPDYYPDFSGMCDTISNSEKGLYFKDVQLSAVELLNALADHVTLYRKSISLTDLDELIDLLNSIKIIRQASS